MIFKTTEDGSLTNIFKELKSVQTTFDELDKTTLRSVIKAFNNTSMSVDDLSSKFGGLDDSVIDYLKTTEKGKASVDGLSKAIANSSDEMGSATVKAELLSKAMNTITNVAATLIIRFVAWGLDELIVTLDEQKEKLEESIIAYENSEEELKNINDELKTTAERIDELNKKDNLTFTEQDELEKLIKTNDELERKIYLLEKANKEAEKEVVNEAQKTYDKYTNNREIGAVGQIDFYTNSSLLENVNWNNYKNDLSWLVAQYKKQQELLTEAQSNGWTNIEEQSRANLILLEGYMSEASLDYQDLYDKISSISDYSMTDDLKTAKDDLDDILNIVAEILGYGGQRAETNFDDIWNSDDFYKYKTELEKLAKEGKLDASVLESNENYKRLLEETGATAESTAQHINALVKEEKKSGQLSDKTNILSISETISQLNTQLRPAFDSLSKAWKEIFTIEDGQEIFSLDSVNTDMLYSIQETISKLNELDEVSIDTRSYENLAKVLTNANSSAEDVKKSFNAFATSIVDGVAVTKEFNESTKDTCIKLLEEMGIVNADEIVIQKLNQAKLNHKIASMDFSQTTADEIRELVSYGESLNLTKQQVFGLYIQQLQLNNNPIQAKNSIIQLYSLTKAGTETANALLDVYKMMDLISKGYQALENGELSEAQARVTELEISKLENKINKRLSDMVQDVDVNWDGLYPDKEETKSSAKDTTESFDWIERAVESLQNRFNSLQKIVDSTFTTTAEKAKALSDQLGLINKEIELQQYAYEEYMAKAESIGLSDNYKNLVQNGAINIEDITDKDLQSAISKYQEYYDKAQDTLEEINSLHEEAMQKHVGCYELEADGLKSKLDSQSITEKQYIDEMLVLWEKYYANQVELAEVAKEKKLELLDEEKSYLQSVANAATTLLDNQIDDLEDQKDSAVKVYEDQIESIENLKKPLQDQLDMMEKARDKEEKILALQKAQYELRRAENHRSQLKYVDGQMVYTADNKAIKDAQNNLDDAEFELAKFKIQEQIDAYDKQIEKLNELIDQTEKCYDTQIDGLNKYKYEWQKSLDMEELGISMKNFTDMFGENSIGKLLSGDMSLIKDWKQSYLDTLKDIDITSNGTIGEITKQFADLAGIDLSNTSAQTQDIASQFDTLGESVHTVTSSISNPDATENEEDINSLTSAIQTSYSAASETIPAQTEMMNSYADSVRNVTSEINNLISAIERLSSMSITVPSLSGNAYANGTRNAEKGLALIGEEKPELVVTNDDKVLVAEKPTLVNMEGGEKVFNGDETKNLFENKSIRPLRPEDSPILHKISQMNPDEIMAKFGINSAMPVRSTLFDTAKSIANSNMVNNNNKPSYSVGDVHIHCPGVTKDEVAKQIGTEMTKTFFGLENKALQRANITR